MALATPTAAQPGLRPGSGAKAPTFRRSNGWRKALPVLKGAQVELRDLQLADAPTLHRALTNEQVTRFISPPPASVAGFERFIEWTWQQREAGEYLCFGVVPVGCDAAIGIIQVRRSNGSFDTAEWGFAIAESFWGTGLFLEAARLVLTFCFSVVGVRRVEARAATANGRGNGALRKLGASCEGLLKRAFLRDGRYLDQFLWAITRERWEIPKAVWG